VRLDDVTDIEDMDFLKIDVQGAELSIFHNAPRLMAQVLLVQTEVEFLELYKGQPMFADVDMCLRQQGMQFHAFNGLAGRTFKPLVVNNNPNAPLRQVLWSDALYVRDWMHLEALSVDKLKKYALLAHDVLNSCDLAHLVLSALDKKTGSTIAETYMHRLLQGG
jgi:hypothetical protein